MESKTTILKSGDSHYVRIPAEMARYFKLNGKTEATIQDINETEAKIRF